MEEKFTAGLVPSAEARDVTVSLEYSRDTLDAGGSHVGLKQERVRRRTTGQCITTGQRLVNAVAGDQNTDRYLDTDIDVRVTSQPCFPEREAGAIALPSRAQEMPHDPKGWEHFGQPRSTPSA